MRGTGCAAPQRTYVRRIDVALHLLWSSTYVLHTSSKNSGVERSSGIPQVEDFVEGLAWNTSGSCG